VSLLVPLFVFDVKVVQPWENGVLTILSVLDTMVDMRVRAKSKHPATTTVTATEAKTRFGPLLETAIRGGSVVITKHDAPKAVLLSIAEFEALGGSRQPDLRALSADFDSLVARLQTPGSRKALKSAFEATPRELGRLAVANHRRRG
jgi:antitoxin Phd